MIKPKSKIYKMDEEKVIEERAKNVFSFLKKPQIWVIGFLIIAVILGSYIRSMPMHDHNPNVPGRQPGLWDITTDTWTLGPDLDPWLFERYAKTIVEQGGLPKIDMMRNTPLGFDTSTETILLPYMIIGTYHLVNLFGDYPIEFAAVIFPVIMFILTIFSFFLFVREIFIRKSKQSVTKANIISLISTFFMIIIPVFLSRTIAGIPEKESAGFFFMFLSFYLFLKAWKSGKIKNAIIFSILAGVSTALLGLIWGGVMYIFLTIGLVSLIAFILNKINKKEVLIYSLWIVFSFMLMLLFSNRFSLKHLITSIDSGFAFLVLIILLIHLLLWGTKLKDIKILTRINLPKNVVSFIVSIVLIIVFVLLLFGPSFITSKISAINNALFNPITGRWGQTVAENRQPYFTEWSGNFGPFLKKIPILFWLFFIGSIVLFKNMLNKIKNKDSWILTGLYILFFFGLVFSRYSATSILNGDNFISKLFYFGSSLLLGGFLIYYYTKYYRAKNESFKKINFENLFLFSLLIIILFTVRGAVRLIMVLAPIASIFVGYLIVQSFKKFKITQDETFKIILGSIFILILLLSVFAFWSFYRDIKVQAYSFVPSTYNHQWQKAMSWVREETPNEAIFAHWWDYGYWLQSIGNRATVLDGGNAITYWNYLMGRLVLTGDNQNDALEFLYNHNATHLLIDSSDIGKYGAFSSIGSNKELDRYSWMAAFLLDETQTQETKNQTLLVYPSGISLDEDLIIESNGKEVLLPKGSSGVGAIIVPSKEKEGLIEFSQPYAVMVYQGNQYNVFLRYLYANGKIIDFNSGIEATIYLFPRLIQQGQSINQNPIGAAIYLSPRLMRGMLTQVYILNDPFDNFPNLNLVHSEQNFFIDNLNQQGMGLPDLIYYQGVQGPIKIWEIEYSGNEEIKQEYLDTDAAKYLDWNL